MSLDVYLEVDIPIPRPDTSSVVVNATKVRERMEEER